MSIDKLVVRQPVKYAAESPQPEDDVTPALSTLQLNIAPLPKKKSLPGREQKN
jgi:hypothetical protein